MLTSKFFAVSLLFFCLSLHLGSGADPLYHLCFSKANYAANSPFRANLNVLINLLSTKAPPFGFGLSSTGQAQNHVQGLALCRGDVSRSNCKSCIVDAGKELKDRCPHKKGAIIWYDNCLVKYSNADFFGKIDNKNKIYLWNVKGVDNPTSFNRKVKDLLRRLSSKAYANRKLYASGQLKLGSSQTLYGLVQCTRDLSGPNCKKCLDGAISELPKCCDGKRGGRVVGGSCNFRYELYPFVNA